MKHWDLSVLALALVGVGVGLLASRVAALAPAPVGATLSSLVLWACIGAPVLLALVRSRPAGLLRIKPIDLLWGAGLGLILRLLQGALSGANGSPFPSALTLDSFLPIEWWVSTVIPAVFVAPLFEEFLFRGVILVSVFEVLRRQVGALPAGLTSLLASTGGFVLIHAAFVSPTLPEAVAISIVGACCSLTVFLTGRIWAAVFIHAVYNGSYLALVLIGVLLS